MTMITLVLRTLQLVFGIGTGLLGLVLFIYITVEDAALQPPPDVAIVPTSENVIVFFMLVLPGMLVAIGTYLQIIRGKIWAMALILIGAISNVFLIILNPGLLYAMSGDIFGQRLIIGDFIAVAVTFLTSWPNALVTLLKQD